MTSRDDDGLACPVPHQDTPAVLLAHGGGGRQMHALLAGTVMPRVSSSSSSGHDAAVLDVGSARLAFTTDGFVVDPLFFAGGDIGALAVCGTVNDLAMAGAMPRALSLALTLEEGTPLSVVERVLDSVGHAARVARVEIATGDTKVVERGRGFGLFLHTSGIGLVDHRASVHPSRIEPGDVVLVSGDVGRHGIAVLAARGELGVTVDVESDVAPLADEVHALFEAGVDVHCLRDPTRGGLGSTLVELAEQADVDVVVDELRVPLHPAVRGACALLGLDPLAVASEGRYVAVVAPDDAVRALDVMRRAHASAARLGVVAPRSGGAARGRVSLRTAIGTLRAVDMPSGELLPRIC